MPRLLLDGVAVWRHVNNGVEQVLTRVTVVKVTVFNNGGASDNLSGIVVLQHINLTLQLLQLLLLCVSFVGRVKTTVSSLGPGRGAVALDLLAGQQGWRR